MARYYAGDAGPVVVTSAGVFALVEAYDYPYLVGLQYRGRPLTAWSLQPGIGFSAGSDGMSFLCVDLARDFTLPRRWFPTLSLAGARLGLGGYHISNAGLADENNGTEAIALTMTLRLPLQPSRGDRLRSQSSDPSSPAVAFWAASPAAANRSSSSRRMSSPASAR
jgi:hypothetical protein